MLWMVLLSFVPGVDTRQGPIENWNGGRSGYYLRKFVDPTLDPQYVNQDIHSVTSVMLKFF